MAESGVSAAKVVLYSFLGVGVFVVGSCLACAALIGNARREVAAGEPSATPAAAVAAEPRRPTYEERRAAEARREADAIASGLAAARSQKPTPASKLASDYQRNELAADQRYKDGWWKIEGVVERVAKDIGNSPYITLRGKGFSSVQCFLEGPSAQAATQLERGDLIEVAGQVTGLMMNVLVKHCEFL